MANPNGTSTLSQDAIIKSTPPQHFSIVYHDTLKLLLRTHNSLLRTYMALQTLGDGNRITRGLVKAVMEAGFSSAEYGTTEQEILASIQKLREMGFVWALQKEGKPDELYLMPFLNDQQKAKFQGRTNELPAPSAPAVEIAAEIREEVWNTAPWDQDVDEGPQDEAPAEPVRQVSSSRRRSQVSTIDIPAQLPSMPALSPWWKGHEDHLKFLGAIYNDYPKKSNIKYALDAWETLFSEGEELTQDEQKVIWNGLQWWYSYWTENNTEEKYIPNLSRFIEREQWLPEVIQEREQKDAARNRR